MPIQHGICHNLGFICYGSFIQPKNLPWPTQTQGQWHPCHLGVHVLVTLLDKIWGEMELSSSWEKANSHNPLEGNIPLLTFQTVKSPMCFSLADRLICSTEITRAAEKNAADYQECNSVECLLSIQKALGLIPWHQIKKHNYLCTPEVFSRSVGRRIRSSRPSSTT